MLPDVDTDWRISHYSLANKPFDLPADRDTSTMEAKSKKKKRKRKAKNKTEKRELTTHNFY